MNPVAARHQNRFRRLLGQALSDRLSLAGLGLALAFGVIANGALHAGNYDMAARGSDSGMLGLATAVQAIGIMMAAPLLALLTARQRRVNLALIAGGLTAAGFLSIFAGLGLVSILAGRFVLGCGIGLGMAFTEFMVISRARRNLRPLFAMAFGLVLAGGHMLGTLLTGLTRFPAVPLALSLGIIIASLLLSRWGELPPQQNGTGLKGLWQVVAVSPAVYLAAALFGVLDNGFLTMLPDFFAHAGMARAGLVATSFAAFAGIWAFQLPAGYLTAKFEPAVLLRATILMLLAAIIVTAFTAKVPQARMSAVFVTGGLVDLVYTIGLLSLAAATPRTMMATANACFVSFCGLGEVAGPLATGQALQYGGFAGGICLILGLLAAFWLGSAHLRAGVAAGKRLTGNRAEVLTSPAFGAQPQ